MKFNIENTPKNPTTKIVKFAMAISIAFGIAVLASNFTDNETAMYLSSIISGFTTFYIV